jgi:hypothetical protein
MKRKKFLRSSKAWAYFKGCPWNPYIIARARHALLFYALQAAILEPPLVTAALQSPMQLFLALHEEARILIAFAYLCLCVFNKDDTN